jgi:hypothetical protein
MLLRGLAARELRPLSETNVSLAQVGDVSVGAMTLRTEAFGERGHRLRDRLGDNGHRLCDRFWDNGQRLREGDSSRDGMLVERIESGGAVINYRGSRFLLTRN